MIDVAVLIMLCVIGWQIRIYFYVPKVYRSDAVLIEHGCRLRACLPGHRASIATVVLTPDCLFTKDVLTILAVYGAPSNAIEREILMGNIQSIERAEGRYNVSIRVARNGSTIRYDMKVRQAERFIRDGNRLIAQAEKIRSSSNPSEPESRRF